MANPFGMAEFSVPAMIGLDTQIKDRRLQQLYMQRQQGREDYMFERQQKADQEADATKAAYAGVFGGGVAGASGATPVAAPAPTSPVSPPGAPVSSPTGAAPGEPAHVAAPAPSANPIGFTPDPAKLRALAATGPAGYQAAVAIQKMNAEQVKSAQEAVSKALELEGQIISGVRKMPPAQRDAEYQRQKAALAQQGVDTRSFPPTWDENQADAVITSSMKTAEALGLDQQAANHAETVRHNKANEHHDVVTEGNAAGTLQVARGNLAVRQDALKAATKPGANTPTADLLRAAGLGN